MSGLINGTLNLSKYVDVILETPTPDSKTISGKDDVNNSDNNIYNYYKSIKDKYSKLPLPYPDFKKDYPENVYPTKGVASSSYFMKTGNCRSNINDKDECLKKGYTWKQNTLNLGSTKKFFKTTQRKKTHQPKKNLNGICYKPKFIYINNIPKRETKF